MLFVSPWVLGQQLVDRVKLAGLTLEELARQNGDGVLVVPYVGVARGAGEQCQARAADIARAGGGRAARVLTWTFGVTPGRWEPALVGAAWVPLSAAAEVLGRPAWINPLTNVATPVLEAFLAPLRGRQVARIAVLGEGALLTTRLTPRGSWAEPTTFAGDEAGSAGMFVP